LTQLEEPELVFQTLQAVIDHQLTEPQTQSLVEWIQEGKSAESFNPALVSPKSKTLAKPTAHSPLPSELADKVVELGPNAVHTPVSKHPAETADTPLAPSPAKTEVRKPETQMVWEWLAGISFISQIRSKLKKGEPLNGIEKILVLGYQFGKGLTWIVKHVPRLTVHAVKFVWKLVTDALKVVGLYQFVRSVMVLAVCLGILLFAWDVHQHGLYHPFRVIGSFFSSHHEAEVAQPPASTAPPVEVPKPAPVLKASVPKPIQPAVESAPVASSVSPWNPDVESQAYLESELAALPPNCLIKPFTYKPGAMNYDMASRRLEDLTDSEKYLVRLGQDKRKLLTITPSASNCVLTFQPGLLGEVSKIEIYWEDVRALHINQVESGSNVIFQLALFVVDGKKPLIIQTNSAANLERLVSALEFDLKNARGNAAPVAGLPYLNQGLRLDSTGLMITLWTGSPMDKADAKAGEHAWSINQNTKQQQKKTDLETALQALTPGAYDFYVVTQADWAKAIHDRDYNHSYSFNPARVKVSLQVP
jgi:hypothetical protein